MDDKNLVRNSKFLSLVLRHEPDAAGVTLDKEGWIDIDTLLKGCASHGHAMTREELDYIVANNDKKRFIIEGSRIRATQGHSIEVELKYDPVTPPPILYHGTATRFVASIKEKGLIKGDRQHVHLSPDIQTASKVGKRHGYPVVIVVKSALMHEAGFQFFHTPNNVWLTDHVPPEYLMVVEAL